MATVLWKGKGREEPPGMDLEELNPVITFRHLLSSGLGVRNPLRVIGLCDMDAFYAACEQVRLGIDPSVPLVVRQWDSLIAVNYPARKYGISRMDKVASALERCPDLRVVHVATFDPATPDAKPTYIDEPNSETHKVSLDHYRKESRKIIEVFKEVLAEAEVERASIDEAFIDLTDPVRKYILACFPDLATPPPEGLDTPLPPPPPEGIPLTYPPSRTGRDNEDKNIWSDLGTLVPISAVAPVLQQNGEVSTPGSLTKKENLDDDDDELDSEIDKGDGPSRSAFIIPGDQPWSTETPEAQEEEEATDRIFEGGRPNGTNDVASDTELPPTWHDVALSIAASLMLKMRDEVKKRLGYTTSAGIARNKFLAKLVASYKKRDNQTILRNPAIPNYLRPLPFQKIRFLGGKLGTALAEAYDAQTVGDLLYLNRIFIRFHRLTVIRRHRMSEEMQRKFGESSIWVWEVLRGIDRSEVKEKPSVTKSMGASKNLQHPITHPSEGAHWLRILAGELAFRLTEGREDNPGLWPKTLVLSVKRAYEASHSRQGPFPFTRTLNTDYICKAAEKLWTELVGTGAEYERNKAKGTVSGMKITHVFLGFSGVETLAPGQRNIDGFFSPGGKRKAEDNNTGTVMDNSGKRDQPSIVKSIDHDPTVAYEAASRPVVSFRCKQCGKELRQTVDDHVDRGEALGILKTEHEDFHFAQVLARENEDIPSGKPEGTGQPLKKKAKKMEPKGIAKFFTATPQKKR